MEKIGKEQLITLKLELENLRKDYRQKNERTKELLKVPEVIEYENIIQEKEMLGYKINNVQTKYLKALQSTCEHPLWYFISDETDSYEQRQSWQCRCLNCGSIDTAHSREFEGKLLIASVNMGFGKRVNATFGEVYNEYNNLKETNNLTNEELAKIMIDRYKEKSVKIMTKQNKR